MLRERFSVPKSLSMKVENSGEISQFFGGVCTVVRQEDQFCSVRKCAGGDRDRIPDTIER